MTKRRIICPECGHRHTITFGSRRVRTPGVRATRTGKNTFTYAITLPPQGPDDDGPPITPSSTQSDLILTAALTGGVGALSGYLAYMTIPPFTPHAVVVGALGGITLGWGWLLAEHNQRLKRVLPQFLENLPHWQRPDAHDADGVTFTVDHRYRDGSSEAGRTINYFGTLPVDLERFNEYVATALRGDSLAIAHWTGAGKLFSRNEYDALLDTLRRAECIVNRPGKGNELTMAGRRCFTNHLKGVAA